MTVDFKQCFQTCFACDPFVVVDLENTSCQKISRSISALSSSYTCVEKFVHITSEISRELLKCKAFEYIHFQLKPQFHKPKVRVATWRNVSFYTLHVLLNESFEKIVGGYLHPLSQE